MTKYMGIVDVVRLKHFRYSWRFLAIRKIISKLGLQSETAEDGTITVFGSNFKYDPVKKIEV